MDEPNVNKEITNGNRNTAIQTGHSDIRPAIVASYLKQNQYTEIRINTISNLSIIRDRGMLYSSIPRTNLIGLTSAETRLIHSNVFVV